MTRLTMCALIQLLAVGTTLNAASFVFNTDPFGSADPNDNVRQIVNVQASINFDPTTDVIRFDPALTGFSSISFANDLSANLPTTGLNAVVLLDQPAAAGSAHTAIANRITDSGPGFFIYFNTGLNLPRLVYARDLGDPNADIAILARMENLSGNFTAMQTFTEANFAPVPEPSTALLMSGGMFACVLLLRRRSA
ncbi:MAG TPA: PEP-CTERM sorting domain-containing protein [Bryobacteraceae bacterium]|nr:PEP-CTERM sorting domain-containing protein [Bryobacteraceae bacterium]